MVVSADGRALMLFFTARNETWVRERSPSGTLGGFERITTVKSQYVLPTGLVIDRAGRGTVVMDGAIPGTRATGLYVQQATADGALGRPVAIARESASRYILAGNVVADSAAEVTITWARAPRDNSMVCCATVSARNTEMVNSTLA